VSPFGGRIKEGGYKPQLYLLNIYHFQIGLLYKVNTQSHQPPNKKKYFMNIIVTTSFELSTDRVLDWLGWYEETFERINVDKTPNPNQDTSIRLEDKNPTQSNVLENLQKAQSIWFRRPVHITALEKNQIFPFALNILSFTEAQQHNIGLNRKVCIDAQGNIKNYVSHQKSFGHIDHTDLKSLITTQEFQEKWHISNDQIHQCQDCQYRYVCLSNTDLEKKEDIWHKKNYCDFSRYQS